jgi:hypothetical protein
MKDLRQCIEGFIPLLLFQYVLGIYVGHSLCQGQKYKDE